MDNTNGHHSLDSHQRLTISLVLAVITFFLLYASYETLIAIVGAWNVFALTDIILAWRTILRKNAKETVQNARLQDFGRSTILIFMMATALMSLVAISLLLKLAKHSTGFSVEAILALAILTVIISWTLVHTVFAIHYAHLFYANVDGSHKGGLEFPKETSPAFVDFAYYSFVVGMTFQVSDVQVSSGRMRKLTLIHSLISFLFNTFILAVAVNLIAGLL
jgi:uncharacterized membrane protein